MIRKLLATTAIALIATSGAMAAGEQKQAAGVDPVAQEYLENLGEAALASNVIGATVYTSEADDAEVVGDINDLVVADDGSIEAAVIGVGGFLGVGEKNVAVSFDSIRWFEKDGEQTAVLETTKEDLEAAPEFVPEETAMAPADEPLEEEPAEGTDDTAAAPSEEPAEGADDMAAAPAEEPAEGADVAEAPAEEPAEGADVAEAPAEEPAAEATEDMAAAPTEEPAEGTYAEEPAEGADVAEAPAEEPAAEATEDLAAAPAEKPAEATEEVAEAPAEEPAAGTDIAQAPVEEPLTQPDPSMAPADQATGPVLADVTSGSISAEQLIGATVYASDDENVGDVGDVRLMADGSGIDAVIIDVGGFLGIGEKPVALAFEALTFKTDESGSLYVYTEFTRDELDAAPEYDETAYEAERDTMRLSLRE